MILVSGLFAGMRKRGLMKDEFHYYQEAYNLVGREAGENTGDYCSRCLAPCCKAFGRAVNCSTGKAVGASEELSCR